MDTVSAALAPLTVRQLQLRAAPHERSVGEIAVHIVAGRMEWFHDFMGEGGEEIALYMREDAPWATAGAAELVEALDLSCAFMAERFARWSSEDMQVTFPHEWRGNHYEPTRS